MHHEFQKILSAAKGKANKTYPSKTALVIPFDDRIAIDGQPDEASLDTFILKRVIPEVKHFRRLAVLGWSKRTFLENDLRSS